MHTVAPKLEVSISSRLDAPEEGDQKGAERQDQMAGGGLAEGHGQSGGHGDNGPVGRGIESLAPDVGSPYLGSVEVDQSVGDLLDAEAVAPKLKKRLVFRRPVGHNIFPVFLQTPTDWTSKARSQHLEQEMVSESIPLSEPGWLCSPG